MPDSKNNRLVSVQILNESKIPRNGISDSFRIWNRTDSYQELFFTPGIRPLLAASRKQMRQSPNFLMKPCLRPHLKQRRVTLDLNLGFFFDLAICACVAIKKSNYFSCQFRPAGAEITNSTPLSERRSALTIPGLLSCFRPS